jgi:DNA-binding response OmpR family regulator
MARILIVDDDPQIRKMVALLLTNAGHTVVEAPNGRDAVDAHRRDPVQLVITDIVMPEQEGIETIEALRQDWPGLPVIAISGGLANSKIYLALAGKIGANRTLAKPFNPDQLIGVVSEVLAHSAQPAPEA